MSRGSTQRRVAKAVMMMNSYSHPPMPSHTSLEHSIYHTASYQCVCVCVCHHNHDDDVYMTYARNLSTNNMEVINSLSFVIQHILPSRVTQHCEVFNLHIHIRVVVHVCICHHVCHVRGDGDGNGDGDRDGDGDGWGWRWDGDGDVMAMGIGMAMAM